MSWNHGLFKNQKGVFLVFTAILLPIIFACAGLAMDLGNAFAHKSKLQNAADAAVLAGAHVFYSNESDVRANVKVYQNSNYPNANYPNVKIEGIDYYPIVVNGKEDKSKGVLLTVTLSDEIPTTFMKMFQPTIPIRVKATCKVTPGSSGGGSGSVFDYAIIGAADPKKFTATQARSSVDFACDRETIEGKVYANSSVWTNNTDFITIKNPKDFYTSATSDEGFWTNPWCYMKDGNGNVLSVKNATHVDEKAMDISISPNNPMTKSIYDYIEDMRIKYKPVTGYEKPKDPIYVNTSGDYSNTRDAGYKDYQAAWFPYKVVIVDGDWYYGTGNWDSSFDYAIIISLHGDVYINNAGSSNKDPALKALIFAPNGKVEVTTPGNFEGSIVAQNVIMHSGPIGIKGNNFGFGPSKETIILYPENYDGYGNSYAM